MSNKAEGFVFAYLVIAAILRGMALGCLVLGLLARPALDWTLLSVAAGALCISCEQKAASISRETT